MTREEIWAEILAERERQAAKWDRDHDWGYGDCSSPHVAATVKAAVLAEECGEAARAVLDKNDASLRAELVQVAAVAVAWLECVTASSGGRPRCGTPAPASTPAAPSP